MSRGNITKNEKSHSFTGIEFRNDSIYIGFDKKKQADASDTENGYSLFILS